MHGTVELHMQGTTPAEATSRAWTPARGLRTGAPESPWLLGCVLAGALDDVVRGWRRDGRGAAPAGFETCFVWVDNLYILARSWPEARAMLTEASRAVAAAGLRWKDDLAEVLVAGAAAEPPRKEELRRAGVPVTMSQVPVLKVLGAELRYDADPAWEPRARLQQAQAAWHMRRRVLASRRADLPTRMKAFAETVLSRLLPDGCGGWHWSRPLLAELRQWERKKCMAMARPAPPPADADEFCWAAWRARLRAVCGQARAASGAPALTERAAGHYHRTCQMISKDDPGNEARRLWAHLLREGGHQEWSDAAAVFRVIDPGNRLQWKLRAAGRPRLGWQGPLDETGLHINAAAVASRASFVKIFRRWARSDGDDNEGHDDDDTSENEEEATRPSRPTSSAVAKPAREDPTFPKTARVEVEGVVDAAGVALAVQGKQRVVEGCAGELRKLIGATTRLWDAGVRWRSAEPVIWTSREHNDAADFVCSWARGRVDRTMRYHIPLKSFAQLETVCEGQVCARLFSDGGRAKGAGTWAAVVAVWARGGWRIAAIEAGQSAGTVPWLEAHAASRAWALFAAMVADDGVDPQVRHGPAAAIPSEVRVEVKTRIQMGWPAP